MLKVVGLAKVNYCVMARIHFFMASRKKKRSDNNNAEELIDFLLASKVITVF